MPVGIAVRAGPIRLLAGGLGVVFVFLMVRNTGLYPGMFADEYYYNAGARLLPMADAPIPDHVFNAVYRPPGRHLFEPAEHRQQSPRRPHFRYHIRYDRMTARLALARKAASRSR